VPTLRSRPRIRRGNLRRAALLAGAGLAVTALALTAYKTDSLRRLELDTVDARFAVRGSTVPPRDLLIVRIDEATFTTLQQRWPFPRSFHARVIRRITRDRPQVIAYDVQFTEETTPVEDNALIRAVAAAGGKVVLAASAIDERGRTNVFGGDAVLGPIQARVGSTGLPTDPGGVLRRVPHSVSGLESFALVAAEVALSRPIRPSDLGGETAWIDFHGPPGTIPAVSFWRVLENKIPPGFFAGKVVVVGASAATLQDLHPTSAAANDPMSGPEIEANAISTALAGFPLKDAPEALAIALIVLFGLLVPVTSLRVRLALTLPIAAVIALLYAAAAQVAFNTGFVLPVVYPLGALVLAAIAALGIRYGAAALEARSIRLDRSGQFAVGLELGGYKIERTVGRGGGGTVYLATDIALRRKVALKVLNRDLAADRAFRGRFLYESQLAAALDNPHVVPIYAAGEKEDRLFLAMKFVPGSLAALLRRDGALGFDRAIGIVEQVSDALDAAHSLGLVHRDVTPSNILLEPPSSSDSRDHAYLADFGLAVRRGVSPGELVGKPDYLAPEQIRGDAVDGRADQYSLGCVLYECLAGEPPFASASEIAVIGGHLSRQAPPLQSLRPDLPTALDEVFAQVLAKQPEERYESCSAFVLAARAAQRAGPGHVASAPA